MTGHTCTCKERIERIAVLERDLKEAISYLREGKRLFAPNTTNSQVDDLLNKYQDW